jgi:hypothetical protein
MKPKRALSCILSLFAAMLICVTENCMASTRTSRISCQTDDVQQFDCEIEKILRDSEAPSLLTELRFPYPEQMHGDQDYYGQRAKNALQNGNAATAAQLYLFAAQAAAGKKNYEAAIDSLEQSGAIQSHFSSAERLDRAEGIVALLRHQYPKGADKWVFRLRQDAKNAVIDLRALDDKSELRRLGVILAVLYSEDRLAEAKPIEIQYQTLKHKVEIRGICNDIAKARPIEFEYIAKNDYRSAAEKAHNLLRLEGVPNSSECLPEIATLIRCSIADKKIPLDDSVQQLITMVDSCPVQGNARIDKNFVPILDLSGSQLLQHSALLDVIQRQTFKLMMKAGGFCDCSEYVIQFYKYLDATGDRGEAIRISDIVAAHLENILRTNEALKIREFELSQLRPEQLKETNHLDLAIDSDRKEIARDASFLHRPNPFPNTDEN